MKAATRVYANNTYKYQISIHAAREGGDPDRALQQVDAAISIHAAREGGDVSASSTRRHPTIFQSTPPVKAATCIRRNRIHGDRISIHAAREGGDGLDVNQRKRLNMISIHAAREGGDGCRRLTAKQAIKFQSTPPVKAATL